MGRVHDVRSMHVCIVPCIAQILPPRSQKYKKWVVITLHVTFMHCCPNGQENKQPVKQEVDSIPKIFQLEALENYCSLLRTRVDLVGTGEENTSRMNNGIMHNNNHSSAL